MSCLIWWHCREITIMLNCNTVCYNYCRQLFVHLQVPPQSPKSNQGDKASRELRILASACAWQRSFSVYCWYSGKISSGKMRTYQQTWDDIWVVYSQYTTIDCKTYCTLSRTVYSSNTLPIVLDFAIALSIFLMDSSTLSPAIARSTRNLDPQSR
jgi:hypothetical protein